jgi:hypothetical protein
MNGQVVAVEMNSQGYTGGGGGGSSGYHYVRSLVIDGTHISTNLSNFPILLNATISSLATTANGGHVQNANGFDVLFTADSAGATKLSWEVESYNPATGAVLYWIKVPLITHGTTTKIYMFYGNSAITTDQSNRTATWDSYFTAVYHFENGDQFGYDSTIHAYNATAMTGVAPGTGTVGYAANFAGGGYLSVPDTPLFDQGSGTWEFWFKDDGPPVVPGSSSTTSASQTTQSGATPNFVSDCAAVLTKADSYDSINGIGFATCNGGLFVQAKAGQQNVATQTKNIVTTKGWHHAAYSFTSGQTYAYYDDGALLDSGSLLSFTISSANPLRIGKSLTAAWPDEYIGSLDELRFSNVVRSADWISTEHYNISSPASFVTIGAEAAH